MALRYQQPQQVARINWSNPLTNGLKGLALAQGASTFDVVTGNRLIVTGSALVGSSGTGVGQLTQGGYGAYTTHNNPKFSNWYITTPAVTLVALVEPYNAVNNNAKIAGVLYGMEFYNYYGYVRFSALVGGVDKTIQATTQLQNRKPYVLVLRLSDGVLEGWLNGVSQGTISAPGDIGYAGYAHLQMIGGGGEIGLAGMANLFGIWNRAASDTEIKALSYNPWQIFKPVNQTLFIAATGGTTTGSITWSETNDSYNVTGNLIGSSTGIIAWSEVNDTLTAMGNMIYSGTISYTETNDIYSITGGVIAGSGGSVAWTDSNDTYNISGSITYIGNISYTEVSDIYSVDGSSYSIIAGNIDWSESDIFYMIGSGGTIIPPLGGISMDGGVSYVLPKKVVAGDGITVTETSTGYVVSIT